MKLLKDKQGCLRTLFVLSAMIIAFADNIVFAQDTPAPMPKSKNPPIISSKDKRKQTIDFEDELIQGEVNKPELFYLMQKKQFNFKRLIKLREDFIPEMRRTSEEIQRSGSHN